MLFRSELTVSDILIMYGTENILIFVCRVFVDLTVLFSIPIVIFFGRKGFFSMVSRPRSDVPESLEPESQQFQPIDITTSCELSKNNSKPNEPSNKTLYLYNVIFLAVTYYGVAFLADSIAGIFFLAGLICVCCGMILPPLIWMAVFTDEEKRKKRNCQAGRSPELPGRRRNNQWQRESELRRHGRPSAGRTKSRRGRNQYERR